MYKRHIPTYALLTLAIVLMASGCSSQKNTAKSRFWQSFTAKYNTYYNGTQSYIDASLEKERGNQDNYTEIIPLYPVGNKKSQSLGSGNYDKAIEKCQKAIKLHSIKKRPEWTKSRRKTARDIEWLNRREYNPMMWKAWLLMGRSQFHKGSFDEAAATFSYMSRMYQTQPAIYGKARAWLAKCYIEQEWLYDAEDVIRNMSRDSLDWRAVKEWDYTYADYYIHAGEYEQAIPYLRKVIKHEMRRKQRAREWFLLGQLEAALGHKEEAYKAFQKVTRQNPPYELEFNARIAMTEVQAAGRAKQTISRLKRMAANDNNKEYLDQVYYAMGNVYLLEKDTLNAIASYEKGNEKSTRSGIEKGVLLLKLGDLYWQMEKFGDAQRCYGSAIGMLDKERKDYEELSRRSQILDELAPHTEAIHLQDSLLALSTMPEKERNEAIDRVIEALKKKEKEERKAAAEAAAEETVSRNSSIGNRNQNQQASTTQQPNVGGEWYFYNQLAVSQGKSTFQKQWGKRENADNWQRANKTVVAGFDSQDDADGDTAIADSIANAMEELGDSVTTAPKDSAANDPHKREYYLAQIPFSDEQKAECHQLISDGLFHSGIIFKDKFDHLRLSKKQFDRLTSDYPDFEKMDEVYYHLFLLYSRLGDSDRAEQCVAMLKERHPDSKWTAILSDPYYAENSREGVHIEDSLYAATYEAFRNDRYDEVFANAQLSETRFPIGANRDKFVFIRGLSHLNAGHADACIEDMNYVVKNFPSSRISEMAGMIVNGVGQGRKLHGGKFDLGDVWSRRSFVMSDSDSIASRTFTDDRNREFLFVIAYHPDSLDENQLLFEMARFNFTTFVVRNFDIVIDEDDFGLHLMQVSGFRNFDEAHQYSDEVLSQDRVTKQMRKARRLLISRDNLELLGRQYSYDDYEDFYLKHFAPLRISNDYLLTEPVELGEEPEPGLPTAPATQQNEEVQDDGGFDVNDDGNGNGTDDDGFDIETPAAGGNTSGTDDDGFDIETPAAGGTGNNGGNTSGFDDDGFDIEVPAAGGTGNNGGNTSGFDDDGFDIEVPAAGGTGNNGGNAGSVDDNEFILEKNRRTVDPRPQTKEPERVLPTEDRDRQRQQMVEMPTDPPAATHDQPVELSVATQPQQQAQKKKKKEPIEIDLEDEYYELDGF